MRGVGPSSVCFLILPSPDWVSSLDEGPDLSLTPYLVLPLETLRRL